MTAVCNYTTPIIADNSNYIRGQKAKGKLEKITDNNHIEPSTYCRQG